MRLNARGDYAGGASNGGSETISINKVAVPPSAPDRGMIGGWLDDDGLFYQHSGPDGTYLALYNAITKRTTKIDPRGANVVRAGGGVWAGFSTQPGVGVFSSAGLHLPNAYLYDVGPDGAIAYKPVYQSAGGLFITGVGLVTGASVDDVQLLGAGRAIWREAFTVRALGIPTPITLPGQLWRPRAAFANGEWWIAYFHTSGLVLHPFDSLVGYRYAPSAFTPDIVAFNGGIRIVWATTEGEAPATIEMRDQPLTAPRIDIRAPIVIPPPPPDDPPQEPSMRLPDAVFQTLVREREKLLVNGSLPEEVRGALLNRVAWIHRPDWGVNRKDGGHHCASPAGNIACDILHHRPSNLIFDAILGDEVGTPIQGDGFAPPSSDRFFVEPVDPGDVEPGNGDDDEDDDTDPRQDADLAQLTTRVGLLETKLNRFIDVVNVFMTGTVPGELKVLADEVRARNLSREHLQTLADAARIIDALKKDGYPTNKVLYHSHALKWPADWPR